MADGDITLTVNLTAGDIRKTASQLRGEIDKIFKANAGKELSASMQKVLADMDKLYTKSTQLEQKLNSMDASELEKVRAEYANANDELRRQMELLEKLKKGGVSKQGFATTDTTNLNQKIADTERNIENLQKTLHSLEEDYDRIAEQGATHLPDYSKNVEQLNEVGNQMVIARARAKALQESIDGAGASGSSFSHLQVILRSLYSICHAISEAFDKLWSITKRVGSVMVNAFKKALSTAKQLATTVGSKLKSAFDKVRGVSEKAFSSNNLKRSLRTLIKYAFGVRSLYFLFRRLRNGIKEGFHNLAQFESGTNATNKAMTELKSSLLYLKNAWGAAFAPIVNAVMPILTQFIDMLAAVGNAIARFIAYFTGQAQVIQAVKVSAGDYAQSLSDASKSAGSAAKNQKKLNDRLADFDDLHVLGEDGASGSGGGGGGGASSGIPEISDMFETIETPVSNLVDMLKDAWDKADFTELGRIAGEKIGKALENAYDWIKGKGRDLVLKIANSIGTFFDGLLDEDNKLGEKIGKALSAAIELAFDFINIVITPQRLQRLGTEIANAINAGQTTLLPAIGKTLGNLIVSAISGFYGFATTFNTQEFITSFKNAINQFLKQMSAKDLQGLSGWDKLSISLDKVVEFTLDTFNAVITPEGASKLGSSLAEAINKKAGYLLPQIGKAVGNIISSAISLFYAFTTTFNYAQFGQSMTSAINNFLTQMGQVDPSTGKTGWKKLGESIGNSITGFLTTLITIVKGLDWNEVGKAIGDCLAGIDVGEIMSQLLTLAWNLFRGLQVAWLQITKDNPLIGAVANIVVTAKIVDAAGNLLGGSGSKSGGLLSNLLGNSDSPNGGGSTITEGGLLATILGGKKLFVGAKALGSKVGGLFLSGWGAVKSWAGTSGIITALGNFGTTILPALTKGLGLAGVSVLTFKGTFDLFRKAYPNGWEDFLGTVTSLDAWEDAFANIGEAWFDLNDKIEGVFEGWGRSIVGIFDPSFVAEQEQAWISGRSAEMLTMGGFLGQNLMEGMSNTITSDTTVTDAFGNTTSSMEQTANTSADNISHAFDGVTEPIVLEFDSLDDDIIKVYEEMGAKVTQTATGVKVELTDTFNGLSTDTDNIFNGINQDTTFTFEDMTDSMFDDSLEMQANISSSWSTMKDNILTSTQGLNTSMTTSFTIMKNTVINMMTQLRNNLKPIANGIIDIMNRLIQGIVSGMNTLVRQLNNFNVKFPEGMEGKLAGQTVKFNLSTLNVGKIPALAQGAVIPPNKQFLAMLGDQRSGTNIEAPLDTIKQAVAEELSNQIGVLEAGFSAVVQAINNKQLAVGDKEIGKANARYINQQKLIRGTSI